MAIIDDGTGFVARIAQGIMSLVNRSDGLTGAGRDSMGTRVRATAAERGRLVVLWDKIQASGEVASGAPRILNNLEIYWNK